MTVRSLNRRDVLKAAGLALSAGVVPACATKSGSAAKPAGPVASSGAMLAPRRHFARVNVSRDRIIRTVVGLRPFRPSGFVVRTEKFGDKTVVHNYGHGGGGMTLSWGTSHLAMEQALATGERTFAVLGSGGVGLATSRLLQRHGCEVTIYAKDLPPDTTSNIAGAQWSPYSVYDDDKATPEFLAQFDRASHLSNRYFQDLVGDYYGVRWLENYSCMDEKPDDWKSGTATGGPLQDLFHYAKDLDADEHPFPAPFVRRFVTMLMEPPVYLNAVTRDFLLAGGKIVIREFKDVPSVLALSESAIVNCTGLGSRALFGDQELIPIKGQLSILIPQPEIDYITLGNDLYMFPRRDGILLGGTHERGEWSMEPNKEAMERVLAGHMAFFSQMKTT